MDSLRGLSAIAVALFHFNEPYAPLPDAYHRALKFGWLGVPVFFVISGFCIASARAKSGLIPFWFRRLSRIYPPYWASAVLVLAVVGLRLATTGTNDVTPLPKEISGWLYTLAALTSPASSVQGLNWVYWSLGYELAFYLLMGILGGPRTLWPLYLLSFAGFFVPGYPLDQWALFGLGVACYHGTRKNYLHALFLGAVCVAASFFRLGPTTTLVGIATALAILFPPAFFLTGFLGPLRRAGTISYSLYLVHVPIGCYLLAYYLPWEIDRRLWPSLLQDALFLAGSLLVATWFYRLVEKPSHQFARQASVQPPKTRSAEET